MHIVSNSFAKWKGFSFSRHLIYISSKTLEMSIYEQINSCN